MGGYLTIGYCSRPIHYCFLEIFMGGQGFDEGNKVMRGGIPQSPHLENRVFCLHCK